MICRIVHQCFNASSRPVYNRLVEFESGTTEVIPGLAESWEVSDDGLQYTFHLRPGVKFHSTDYFTPTRDMNADDERNGVDRGKGGPSAGSDIETLIAQVDFVLHEHVPNEFVRVNPLGLQIEYFRVDQAFEDRRQ